VTELADVARTCLRRSAMGVAAGPADALESPREYFRRYLDLRAAGPADLRWYFDQALPGFSESAEVRLAVEELVDRLGAMLGFDTSRANDSEWGRWSSGGSHLLVWALDTAMTVARMSRLVRERDLAVGTLGVPTANLVSCLVVVCGPVNHRLIEDTVALRHARGHVRLVTVDGLLALGGLMERRACTHEEALRLLRPAGAFADPLIALAGRAWSGREV
jgi:hypothetical protein